MQSIRQVRISPKWMFVSLGLAALGFATPIHAQQGAINPLACGPIKTGFGPFDYRTLSDEVRHKVEDYHFTPEIETLRKGNTAATPGPDLDYTLRAFPNSPRALLAMGRLATKMKTDRPAGARWPVECYFERASRFMPDDPMPRVLYAGYLRDRKRIAEARLQLDEAERVRGTPSNSDVDYNLGLLYFETGDYDKANHAAQRAYALGAPLPALMKKLKAIGKWREVVPPSPDATMPGAAPASEPAPATLIPTDPKKQ